MLRKVTVQLPEDWVEALHAECDKTDENLSDMVRRILRRSLNSRGYSLQWEANKPGTYDRYRHGMMGEKKRREHESRLKNRARVRRQLERKRLERDRETFQQAYRFDGSGGVYTDDGSEVAVVTFDGDLLINDHQHSKEGIVAELREAIRLEPERSWQYYHYALAGVPDPLDE